MLERYEAIVVGAGAAGLNAAMLLGRSRRSVLLCDDEKPRNAKAERMHGFLTRDGTPPHELLRIAGAELKRYPSIERFAGRIEWAARDDEGFVVRAYGGGQRAARKLLLATGVRDALPEIDGLQACWGRSVFVCPYCDGWEVQDRRIAALGKGRRAIELAQEIYQWSKDILVCSEGVSDFSDADARWLEATSTSVCSAKVRRLVSRDSQIECVEFEDGSREAVTALFLCAPLRQRCGLASALGARISDCGEIVVDERCRTTVKACFAAGDAVTSVHQVLLAAASGVRAAMAINEELLAEEVMRLAKGVR